MSAELIVSVSGIRGIVGDSLTPAEAMRFAQAYGAPLAGRTVAVSRDGRPSGLMLKEAVLAGLLSVGCRGLDLGIQPTPTVGVAVGQLEAAGAVQITASHNPAEWNGLKLFGADGAVLSSAEGETVARRFRDGAFQLKGWNEVGAAIEQRPDAEDLHLKAIQSALAPEWDGDSPFPVPPGPRFNVWVDANHGAGGRLAGKLLRALGHRPVVVGEEPTGRFAHIPEPTEENLRGVAPQVKQHGCAVGFALDPDADRLALIDENGKCLGEECTLALAVLHQMRQQPGPVAINLSTSRMSEEIAQAAGVTCRRAAVGEANVVALMRQTTAVIGGEGNGGVIDPRIGWVRDPFIGMALILRLLQESGKRLSELAAELPYWEIVKDKAPLDRGRLPAYFARLEAFWKGGTIDRTDGLRLENEAGWLHVRPSNTEPLVRYIAEAKSVVDARRLIEAAKGLA